MKHKETPEEFYNRLLETVLTTSAEGLLSALDEETDKRTRTLPRNNVEITLDEISKKMDIIIELLRNKNV